MKKLQALNPLILAAVLFSLITACKKQPPPYEDMFLIYTVTTNNDTIAGLSVRLTDESDTLAADTTNVRGFAAFQNRLREENQNLKAHISDIDGFQNLGLFKEMKFKISGTEKTYTFIILKADD